MKKFFMLILFLPIILCKVFYILQYSDKKIIFINIFKCNFVIIISQQIFEAQKFIFYII